jgi:hypothetical protein
MAKLPEMVPRDGVPPLGVGQFTFSHRLPSCTEHKKSEQMGGIGQVSSFL